MPIITIGELFNKRARSFVKQFINNNNSDSRKTLNARVLRQRIQKLICEEDPNSLVPKVTPGAEAYFNRLIASTTAFDEMFNDPSLIPVADFSEAIFSAFPGVKNIPDWVKTPDQASQFIELRTRPDGWWQVVISNIPVVCSSSSRRLPGQFKPDQFSTVSYDVTFGFVAVQKLKDGSFRELVGSKNCFDRFFGKQLARGESASTDVFCDYKVERPIMLEYIEGRKASLQQKIKSVRERKSRSTQEKPKLKKSISKNARCPVCSERGMLACDRKGCHYIRTQHNEMHLLDKDGDTDV